MQKTQIITMLALLVLLSSCTKFECYANFDHAREKADKFCNQANGNKTLCETLMLEKNKSCLVSKSNENICEANNDAIQEFVRIYNTNCFGRLENACQAEKFCKWTYDFKNPINSRVHDR